jgi:UDP-glucose 4-epimerase
MSEKILITGGLGFVGSYLAKRILPLDYEINVLDNLYRGYEERLDNQDNLKIIIGDVTSDALIKRLVKESDIVLHLAAVSQVMTSIKNPDLTLKYNIEGTEKVARYSAKYDKKLIFSSSREVYGSADYLPVDLAHPLKPENPYAASKISGEMIIRSYSNSYGLEYVILRLSNIYGYGDTGRVIPIFIEKAKKEEDLTIFGNDKIIDFVYIKDVAEAFIKSLNYNKNETFNVGSGTSTTLQELAEIIIGMMHSTSKHKIMQPRDGEVDRFTADISKTKSQLGWAPEYDLKRGLSEMIF